MSSAGQKEVLGIVEIVVGEVINYYAPGEGQWLVNLGIETMVAGGLQELTNLLAPSPMPSAQNGIVRSSVANQQIVYGEVKTGGLVVFSDSYGTNNELLVVGVCHSLTRIRTSGLGLGVDGVRAFYVNDVEIPTTNWNSTTGAITAGPSGSLWNPLVGNINIWFYDGSQATSDPTITTNFPTKWASTSVGNGLCYTVFQLFDSTDQATFQAAFPSGIPQMLGVIIGGQKIYDPRLDGTNGGSGSQRLANPSSWTFSSNPALVAADYLVRAKSDGGGGYANSQINWPSIATAANICDENVTVPQYGATWNGTHWSGTDIVARYTCNVGLDTGNTVDQNLKMILDSMAGVCVAANGQLYIYAGNNDTAAGDLDETYLAGGVQLTCQVQRQSMWNAVKMTYGQEPQADYTQTEACPIYNSTYEAEDGGVRLWNTNTLPAVTNQWNAQILEIIQSQRSRNKMVITATCNLKALVYQAWDVVNVSIDELALSNARFRITNLTFNSDMTVTLTLLQENSTTYTLPASLNKYVEYDPPTPVALGLPPTTPPSPTGLAANNVAGGILLQWLPPDPNYYKYESVYRSSTSGGGSGYAKIATVIGDSYLDTRAVSGTKYYYYVTATNYWLNSSPAPSLPVSGANATAKTAPVTTAGALDPITITSPTITGGTTSGTGITGGTITSTPISSSPVTGGTITGTGIDTTTTLGGKPVGVVTVQIQSKSVNLLGADSSARKNLL